MSRLFNFFKLSIMEVNSLHPGNAVNDATQKSVNSHSKFAPSRRVYQTMRYGELTPHFVMESVPKDKIKLRSSHDIRSYTLKAPIMSDISIKKDYFSVPLQAILPFNADKLYTNPVVGDDVVAEDVNCVIDGSVLADTLSAILTIAQEAPEAYIEEEGETVADYVNEIWSVVLRQFVVLEYFLSSGSLLRNLGYSFSSFWDDVLQPKNTQDINNFFDYRLELWLGYFLEDIASGAEVMFAGDTTVYIIDPRIDYSFGKVLCVHDFLERIRQNPLFTLSNISVTTGITKLYVDDGFTDAAITVKGEMPEFNFLRPAAYQIVCHHFYSNDHIDYIYSAELFRQLLSSYISLFYLKELPSFDYNGVATLYDWLAGVNFRTMLASCVSASQVRYMTDQDVAAYSYVSALFSFRRSLRYVDYFTGARSQPLAVGDVNVAVASNLVNIVDVTKKTQAQRFLNAVNRAGRKLVNYVSEIFGVTPAYDYHDPAFLAHTADSVRVVENENTGAAQWSKPQSVTGVFRSNAERYSFEFDCDRPSILIGITYFDIPRCYGFSNDRCNLHVDRFDMFNPFMQFIGDQPISLTELGVMSDAPFAYTLRHMEYKQSFDIAAGGFVDDLPGFAFVQPVGDNAVLAHISPDWIRSKNYELDRYYLDLTGNCLSKYFHFIVVNTNYVDAGRPMAYAPSIL